MSKFESLDDFDFLLMVNDQAPIKPPIALISEYIHGRRILPPGTPKPGQLDIHYAPYAIEIMDCMAPYSGVNIISVLKAAQTTLTSAAENCMAYYMDEKPEEIIYCSGTDDLLTKWTKRLESLISSCGFRDKIVAQNDDNKKSRKAGDKAKSKEYAGGSLSLASLQAPASLRMESKKIIFIDEIDAAPPNLSTGEGSGLKVVHARAMGFGSRGKFMEYSTPTTYDRSTIWKRYELGDKRKYFVPCVKCGTLQELDWKSLVPLYDEDNYLEEAVYECINNECGHYHRNHEKTWMMAVENGAHWKPTEKNPSKKNHRSYHISAMYSPVGMVSWTDFYQEYLDSQEDQDAQQPFMNNFVGMPYKPEGHRPDIKKVIKHRGRYKRGTVPHGVLYLVEASDVQRGAERYQKMSPDELDIEIARIRETKGEAVLWKSKIPRIETEIMGQGADYRTWSVDYFVTYGHTTMGSYMGAFARMDERRQDGGMRYRRDDGIEFIPVVKFMDASDGETQSSVFDVCSRWRNAFPNINDGWLKKKKDPGVDESSRMNFDRYRLDNKGRNVHISTNYYKKRLYTSLNLPRNNFQDMQPPGFSEFPSDYEDHYFKMLTGFEALNDDSFSDGGRPVESGDCRVYCLCASDFWLEDRLKKEREKKKALGLNETQVKQYDKPWLLRKIERIVNVKPAG